MLGIQFVRQNPDLVREALQKRQDSAPLDEILALDEQRRRLLTESESLRAQQKQQSKEYGRLKAKEGWSQAQWDELRGVPWEKQLEERINDVILEQELELILIL